jgi:acetyl-CoA C-acetyltransferase
MVDVHVLGVGMTTFGRRGESLQDLIAVAAEAAIADAGHVDAMIVATVAPEEYLHESNLASQIADRFGLSGIPAIRIETAPSSGAAAFHIAVQRIAARGHRRVLAVVGEKMSHVSTSLSAQIMSQVIDRRDWQLGLSMPAMAALVTSMYANEHGISKRRPGKALVAVAIKNHSNGALSPYAQFQRAITQADYRSSKLIASPLRFFDCAPISDGAAAVVVGSERSPIRVVGIGQATDRLSLCERLMLSHFSATQWAAARAYEMAGFGPGAVTFAEVHDAFTSFELISTEDLGSLKPGTAADAVLRGETALRGRIPINSSGGLKARGHPVGASGLAKIVELVWQMRGTVADERRIPCADVALALSIGGSGSNNFVTLLRRSSQMAAARLSSKFVPDDLLARLGSSRQHPPKTGRGRILAQTEFHITARSISRPRRLALVEGAGGARLLVPIRTPNGRLESGDRVRFAAAGSGYRAAPIDKFRRARVHFRRLGGCSSMRFVDA